MMLSVLVWLAQITAGTGTVTDADRLVRGWWDSNAISITWGQFTIVAIIFLIRAIFIDIKNSRRPK